MLLAPKVASHSEGDDELLVRSSSYRAALSTISSPRALYSDLVNADGEEEEKEAEAHESNTSGGYTTHTAQTFGASTNGESGDSKDGGDPAVPPGMYVPECLEKSLLNPLHFFQFMMYTWVTPLIVKGYKQHIEQSDIFYIPRRHRARVLTDRLEAAWEKERTKEPAQRSIMRAYMRAFAPETINIFLILALQLATTVLQPIFLSRLVFNLSNSGESHDAYLNALGLSLTTLSTMILLHTSSWEGWRLGMDLRAASMGLIYRKTLRISTQALRDTTTGHVVTLASGDIERFAELPVFFPYIFVGPTASIIITYLIWQEIGPASVAGVGTLMLMIPVQIMLSRYFGHIRKSMAEATDVRVKNMSEILGGIRILKMYAWEEAFRDLISELRKRELTFVKRTVTVRGFNLAYFFACVPLASFVSFLTYELSGNTLTVSKAFATMAYYASVRVLIGYDTSYGMFLTSECRVVFQRMKAFLLLADSPKLSKKPDSKADVSSGSTCLSLSNMSCSWSSNSLTLKDISLDLSDGELLAVVGPVGAGKSTLLMAILGELQPSAGTITLNRDVLYASQESWILNATIRDNILFGQPLDEAVYEQVVSMCQLRTDIASFPSGDRTEVGERGITLSGGQKARISLARAAYAALMAQQEGRRPLVLLDDPLSAVDAKVGAALFGECVQRGLSGHGRVLVTHQLQFARNADRILVLNEDGSVAGLGRFEELRQTMNVDNWTLHTAVDTHPAAAVADEDVELQSNPKADPISITVTDESDSTAGEALTSPHTVESVPTTAATATESTEESGHQAPAIDEHKVVEDELRVRGKIQEGVFTSYLRASGSWLFIGGVIALFLIVQLNLVMADWFLSRWMSMSKKDEDSNRELKIYSGLIGSLLTLALIRVFVYVGAAMRASSHLHDRALARVLGAPLRFFDTQPVGRILNRFSRDLGYIDELLPAVLLDTLQGFCNFFGAVGLVVSLNPWLLLALTPIAVLFFFLRTYYLKTAREVKRLEGIMRSPVYAHLTTTLVGLPILRSHTGAENRFRRAFEACQDNHSQSYFAFIAVSRWLGIRLDCLIVLFTSITSFASIAARDSVSAGEAGLSLVYILQLAVNFQWVIRQSAEVENYLTSCERVLEYTRLAKEEDFVGCQDEACKHCLQKDDAVPTKWPETGDIEFRNLALMYTRDSEPVLRGVNCHIRHGQKIGIVGRTGAGKSSLLAAILRLAPTTGSILISGVSTCRCTLRQLRNAVSVIPQDPILFSTTMRKNLDPFDEFADVDVWSALELVRLKGVVEQLPGGLETHVSESGSNFSVGQRQLVCLARAILRNRRILVLDEATANVDTATDALIQATIRQRFAHCTVLTIAHRLNTIMDCDKILVMHQGKAVEFDTPEALLARPDGHFQGLVKQAVSSYNASS